MNGEMVMVWRGCMPTNDRRQSLLLTTTKTSNPHFHGLGFHPHVIVRLLTAHLVCAGSWDT